MENIKNNIFYRPELEIERSYDTTGVIKHESIKENKPSPTSKLEDILEKSKQNQEDLLQIRKVIDYIPKKTAEILKDIIDKLIFQTEIEKEEIEKIIEEDKEAEKNKENTPQKENEDLSDPDFEDEIISKNISFWDDPDPLDIDIVVVKCKDNAQLAYEQYLKDSTYIKEDFIHELNYSLQEYLYPLTSMLNEIGLDSIEYLNLDYEGETVSGVKTDDKHLHDTIVRNQLLIEEKNRKFSKTHSPNITLSIIAAFDIVAQERINYHKEEYDLGIDSFSGIYKRNILEECRNEYNNKYIYSAGNMYKYLKSSVIITSDILKKALALNASKCYLLAHDVNIYARRKYEETAYTNSANDTTIDLEKGQSSTNTQSKGAENSKSGI